MKEFEVIVLVPIRAVVSANNHGDATHKAQNLAKERFSPLPTGLPITIHSCEWRQPSKENHHDQTS